MKKTDFVIALVIGELVAFYFIYLFKFLDGQNKAVPYALPVIFPILSSICLWLAFLIGKKFVFVFQLAKFLLMGVFAALVDLGILNFLILFSGISAGIIFSVFKGVSYIAATCGKYLGDKFWAFEKKEVIKVGNEFFKFLMVTLIGLLINVFVASLIVNAIEPQFGLSKAVWVNIAAIIAAIVTVIWNFPGYKFLVFKK